MKSTFKCACGTTTRLTDQDAERVMTTRASTKPNYNPRGKTSGKKKKK